MFLDRIAQRLRRPRPTAPPPRTEMGLPESYLAEPLGPSGGGETLCERFKRELETVGGRAAIAHGPREISEVLHAELAHWGAKRLVSWAKSEFRGWAVDWLWNDSGCTAWEGDAGSDGSSGFRRAALGADVGITTVDFAIANTGTLVLSAAPERPRSVSLLPTVHLALVRADQLVDRMGRVFAAFAKRPGGPPSAVHFITGPSRTSDIENDLTIGVHGPAVVSVILWQEDTP
jgi:L-lactate dehydrogenase complex protein LldG